MCKVCCAHINTFKIINENGLRNYQTDCIVITNIG